MSHPSSTKKEGTRPAWSRHFIFVLRVLRGIGKPFFLILVGFVFLLSVALLVLIRSIKASIRMLRFMSKYLLQFSAKLLHFLGHISIILIKTSRRFLERAVTTLLTVKNLLLWTGIVLRRLFVTIIRFEHLSVLVITITVVTIAISLIYLWMLILKDLPPVTALANRQPILTTRIFDRNGKLLYKFFKNENRTLIPLSDIPLSVRQATIAIEDKDFYSHQGISIRGVARSMWKNLSSGTLSGGSTITQQLVKNVLLSPEKTWRRKIREAILAVDVEWNFSKDQILEMYLNQVPFGGNTYGIAEAAETYLGKQVQDLNLAEAAYLAGLPASPTELSPYGTNPQLAIIRQNEVLDKMIENNFITQETAERARRVVIKILPPNTNILAPHFVMYIRDILNEKYGSTIVEQGGLQVYTSLDLDIQEVVQKQVTEEINKDRFLRITNGAALVTKPQTGEVLAMVGSRDYFDNATVALRQPGSAIKPINYAAALANGFTAATIIPDTPVTFRIPGQPPYSPTNYDRRFHGNIPLRIALGSSYNIPAVKVLSAIGVFRMIEQGKKMGITTWDDPSRFGLSLTLGGGEVRMTELAVAYGSIANLGLRVDLHPILRIDDSRGHTIQEFTCTDTRLPPPSTSTGFSTNFMENSTPLREKVSCEKQFALDPGVAFILSDILADNSARTPAFGPNSYLVVPNQRVSVKTGTTNDLRDNWTIGFTPNFLVATWVGNFDGSPMAAVASGITGASPIWNKIMASLLNKPHDILVATPADVVKTEICPLTGTLSCAQCPNKKTEYFLSGTAPTTICSEGDIQRILQTKQELENKQNSNGSLN